MSSSDFRTDVTHYGRTDFRGPVNLNGNTPTGLVVQHDATLLGDGSASSPLAVNPAILVSSTSQPYGTGIDGDLNFDGVSAVNLPAGVGSASIVPAAGVYLLPRDIMANNLTIASGVEVRTQGNRVFVAGTLSNAGFLGDRGGNGGTGINGPGGAGGAAGAIAFSTVSTTVGYGGVAGTAGTAAAAGTSTVPTISNAPTATNGSPLQAATAVAVSPANGGVCQGGGGGRNNLNEAGGNGQLCPTATNKAKCWYNPYNAIVSRAVEDVSNPLGTGSSGAGGRGASGADGGGGGGGASGPSVIVAARVITGAGVIRAIGGNGGAAANLGGGGGGGGGAGGQLVVFTNTNPIPNTLSAAGGTGGAAGTLALGAQTNGGNGGAGQVLVFRTP